MARSDFERWIEPETQAIEQCLDSLLSRAGVEASEVERVFMTGGSSFVPVVRRIFADRFGAERLSTGDELMSSINLP